MASPSPGAGPTPVDARPWRKRHPLAARLVLYGIGLAVGFGIYTAWTRRQDQDQGDRVRYLWARLETLPVILPADPEGPEVLKVLDAEYVDPALPEALRARAERLRGIVAHNRKDRPGVDAAFSRARALDPAQQPTIDLEWALCLAALGDGAEARKRLPASVEQPGWGFAASTWHALVKAQAEALTGGSMVGRRALDEALDRLPRPLPSQAPFWFGLDAWQPVGAALEATRWALLDPAYATPDVAKRAWARLAALATDDAEALIASAEGLLAVGDRPAAESALVRARQAHKVLVDKALETRPGLKALGTR
jgi:hypothetical protein